jgi:hypothetical protein
LLRCIGEVIDGKPIKYKLMRANFPSPCGRDQREGEGGGTDDKVMGTDRRNNNLVISITLSVSAQSEKKTGL